MNYSDYQLSSSSRKPEAIEWTETRHYNAPDQKNPRVLLVGDSICNGYQGGVRDRLKDCVNISYWISSKCVTDQNYLRELNYMLECYPYELILFNNGCHSLMTDKKEWAEAYDKVLRFIQAARCFLKFCVSQISVSSFLWSEIHSRTKYRLFS